MGDTSSTHIAAFAALPEVPDFLGKEIRIDSVASMIQAGQQQKQTFRNEMVLNGKAPEDRIVLPNADPSDTSVPTYQQRFDTIDAGINQLVLNLKEEFPTDDEIHQKLVAIVEKKRQQLMQRINRSNSE